VAVTTLESALAREELPAPVLLKIDVQGSEMEVLRGAEHVLRSCAQVLVEASFVQFYRGQVTFWTIAEWMQERGFELVAGEISARSPSGRWLQGDFLFEARTIDGS
jgi:hypothetical protein